MRKLMACLVALVATATANAAIIYHQPSDRVPPVVVSPAFGPLAAGGTVGANYIAYGVDYTWAGIEGIFNDPPLAFGGVNGSNNVDLVSPVDGRIVLLNTLTQGLTNTVYVEAGNSAAGALRLDVFGILGNLLQSAFLNPPTGLNGRFTATITRSSYDIAFFRVSGADTFGVNQVGIEAPVAAAVPEPISLVVFGGLVVGGGLVARNRLAKKAA
mgnify:CR=1 FL=1